MTIGLLVILIGMCLFAMTLEGFWQGVRFILYPDMSHFKPSAAIEALGLSFFTLSLGQGIMLTYGSYMRRGDDIPKTAIIIGVMIIVVSLLAGLMIFPIIFTFGFTPEAGPGLVFKTLPVLFAKLPGALFISTAFFILFVFTALTSAVALIEVVAANFTDLLGWSRKRQFSWWLSAASFLGSRAHCRIPIHYSPTGLPFTEKHFLRPSMTLSRSGFYRSAASWWRFSPAGFWTSRSARMNSIPAPLCAGSGGRGCFSCDG